MENWAIKISGVSKKYFIGQAKNSVWNILNRFSSKNKEFWALKNINFNIEKGEVVGIIGKNGAGKSTLLKILSQITRPTEGKIEINGRISSLLEVGTGFHPELTGRENIFLNGTILGMTRKEVSSKFDEIVTFSGIKKFIDTPVKRYSSGQYVRLAFAVAAHLEPDILIIDEVLAVGDLEFQKKCIGKMKDVAGEGRTVIFVSHNMGAVQSLCNKAILLANGEIISQGHTSTIIEDYMNQNIITSISNRNSESDIYFKDIWLSKINNPKEKKMEFNFNESIQINGRLFAKNEINRSVQICIAILDRNGARITSIIEDISSDKLTLTTHNFALIIPNSIIAPNKYSLLIEVYIPPGYEKFDVLDNVLPFEIIDNGTRMSGYENYGVMLLDHTWKWTE